MPAHVYILIGVIAYLLGSIPFGYLLVRVFLKQDIRAKGSGNIGATNVVRSGAKKLGALTFLLDACKGYFAVWLAAHVLSISGSGIGALHNAEALAALCAILGHIYTVWLRFKGGKGVATALGVFLALILPAALTGLAVFIVVFASSRYVSLASICAAVAFPIAAMLLPHAIYTPWLITVIFVAPIIVIARHHQNIGRLVHGTEYRFGKAKVPEV